MSPIRMLLAVEVEVEVEDTPTRILEATTNRVPV